MEGTTIVKEVSFSGRGLFTGAAASVTILPSDGGGVVFQREDLQGSPTIRASLANVKSTPRCLLLEENGASVQTVEHLLSALNSFGVDNVLVKISGPEIPILDGSAQGISRLIDEAGLVSRGQKKGVVKLKEPLYFRKDEALYIALPSDEFWVSVNLHHPQESILNQSFSFRVNKESYKRDIAPSRTFSLYEEIGPLLEKGLLKGGGLENALVIREGKVLNPEGMRFKEEMARHKILDLIGDLSLANLRFLVHVVAIRPGHFYNVLFAKKLMETVEII